MFLRKLVIRKFEDEDEMLRTIIIEGKANLSSYLDPSNRELLRKVFPDVDGRNMVLILTNLSLEESIEFFNLIRTPLFQTHILGQYVVNEEQKKRFINILKGLEKDHLKEIQTWLIKVFKSDIIFNKSSKVTGDDYYSDRIEIEWLDRMLEEINQLLS